MKKYLSVLFIFILLLSGCSDSEPEIEKVTVSREIMGNVEIAIPENTSALTKAIYEAADFSANTVINGKMKKKPEFIAFEFSSDVPLSKEERTTLMNLFNVYGIEVSEGRKSSLKDIDRGITIGFGSTKNYQLDDCDLTVVTKIYYGKNCYNYCCDFKMVDDEYVMFRTENTSRDWYIQ